MLEKVEGDIFPLNVFFISKGFYAVYCIDMLKIIHIQKLGWTFIVDANIITNVILLAYLDS